MGTINNSFDKLYQYIQSRKDIDNKHSTKTIKKENIENNMLSS